MPSSIKEAIKLGLMLTPNTIGGVEVVVTGIEIQIKDYLRERDKIMLDLLERILWENKKDLKANTYMDLVAILHEAKI